MANERSGDLDPEDLMKRVREDASKLLEQLSPPVKAYLSGSKTSLELLAVYVALLGSIRTVTDSLKVLSEGEENMLKIIHSGLLTVRANIDDMIKELKEEYPVVMNDTNILEFKSGGKNDTQN